MERLLYGIGLLLTVVKQEAVLLHVFSDVLQGSKVVVGYYVDRLLRECIGENGELVLLDRLWYLHQGKEVVVGFSSHHWLLRLGT